MQIPPIAPSPTPGFRRVVISAVFHAQADQIPHLAQAIAFNGFLAIPSALLLAVGSVQRTAGPGSMQRCSTTSRASCRTACLQLVRASMTQLLASDRSDVMIAVGAVFALWSLSGAMQTVMWSLNAAHELNETRGFVRKRIVALLMILVALLAVALVVFMLVLGPTISSWFRNRRASRRLPGCGTTGAGRCWCWVSCSCSGACCFWGRTSITTGSG